MGGRRTWIPALAFLVSATLSPEAAGAADWEWTLTPYLWGAGAKMDVETRGDPVINADASFPEILDKTDMAAMIHFEGRTGKWGFHVDGFYLDLGGDTTIDDSPRLPPGTDAHSDLSLLIAEGGATWRPGGPAHGFDLIFGVREIDLDLKVDLDIPAPVSNETRLGGSRRFTDGLVGARWSHRFDGRWSITLRGDVATGGTEFTWTAIARMGVRLDEAARYTLRFGYRHMAIASENDDGDVRTETDLALSGAIVGLTFRW